MREFFGCYLLKSQHPLARGRSYIGFTVNPRRRIRQHNGHLTCGAKQTRNSACDGPCVAVDEEFWPHMDAAGYRPWEMTLVLYGFPTQVQALQFEWAWQHPLKSKFVRATAMQLGKSKMMGLKGKILLLHEMLHLSPWKLYPLTLQFLAPEFALLAKGAKTAPRHIQVLVAPAEQLPDCLYDDDEAEIKRSREVAVPGCTADGSSSEGSSSSDIEEDPSFCSQQDSGSQLPSQQLAVPKRTTISKQALPEPDSLSQLALSQKVVKPRVKKLPDPDSLSQLGLSQRAVKGTARAKKPAARLVAIHTELSTDTDSEAGGGSQQSPPASPTRVGRVKAVRPVKLKCAVCELAAEQQVLQCAPCSSAFHLQCLADTWILQQAASTAALDVLDDSGVDRHDMGQESMSQLRPSCFGDVPENGNCPVCQEQLGWMNLLQNMQSQGWDQAGKRKGRAKAKASGKARGQASVDEEADDTGVAPVKARRARAPSKSKFVALVPATDEYIESLHLLFAPPPTTASLPDLHKAQASAAPADPLVTVGLPPKRGRGRPGLARSLTQTQAIQPPSQSSQHPGMGASKPPLSFPALQPPRSEPTHKPANPYLSDTAQQDNNMLPNCESGPTAEQDHSEWEQDWECTDEAYQEGGKHCGHNPGASVGIQVPPTPIDLLSTSASEGPDSPSARPSASIRLRGTSVFNQGFLTCDQQQQEQFQQHQEQQGPTAQGLDFSGAWGRGPSTQSEHISKAQDGRLAPPAIPNTGTDGMPSSVLKALPFLERVRARVAAAAAAAAANAPTSQCSFSAAENQHSIDLSGHHNLCDSPSTGVARIHNLTGAGSCQTQAHEGDQQSLIPRTSSTCSLSSMEGSPEQSQQAAAAHLLSSQEVPLDGSVSYCEMPETTGDAHSQAATYLSGTACLPVGLSSQDQLQQPVEMRKRGRSPKKALQQASCEAGSVLEIVAELRSACLDAYFISGKVGHVQSFADEPAPQARDNLTYSLPTLDQTHTRVGATLVAAHPWGDGLALSEDENMCTPVSPFISPSPFPVRRRHDKLAMACLDNNQMVTQDSEDGDSGRVRNCEVFDVIVIE